MRRNFQFIIHHSSFIILFHLAALGLTARLAHWPYLLVLIVLIAAIAPFNIYRHLVPPSPVRPVSPSLLSSLSSLLPIYAVTALRLAIALVARALCPSCSATLVVPEPFASILSFEWAAIFSLTLFIIHHSSFIIASAYQPRLATIALAALGLIWIAALYPRLIPAGVTAADPFAYVQMGIDLAAHGTPLHTFPLARLAFDFHLPVYPTLFVGYTIPRLPDGPSATVWPPGFSALLALAFKLAGERGLYWLNPVIACLSLAATYLLARCVFQLPPFFSVLAATLLLTSLEQTIRLSIPLADLATQLFTTLAIIAAFGPWKLEVGARKFEIWSSHTFRGPGLGLGVFSALAYLTRYTQLLLIPGLVIGRWLLVANDWRRAAGRWPRAKRLLFHSSLFHSSLFIVSFFIVALPDFAYRTVAFGSPFAFASGELAQFSLADVPAVTLRLLTDLAADFNVAVPFIIVGVIALLRRHHRLALALTLVLGPVILFHLPYHYLKLRDLLFIFPALCALAAFGAHAAVSSQWSDASGQKSGDSNHRSRFTLHAQRSLFIVHCSLFILLAFRFNAQLPFLDGFYTYGFLTAGQRAQIESIAALTPPDAIVAGSLNTGAVSLYAGRDTLRPGRLLQPGRNWSDDEFLAFVKAAGRPLYLLMDSEEMAAPAAALRARLTPIAELYLPYYYRDGSAANQLIPLYKVTLDEHLDQR
ncbi:MAG: hypothetical protein HY872_10885 [Chloroflexi bacterium]|nr:hypothetical protein [Chloroflexota bacterium]